MRKQRDKPTTSDRRPKVWVLCVPSEPGEMTSLVHRRWPNLLFHRGIARAGQHLWTTAKLSCTLTRSLFVRQCGALQHCKQRWKRHSVIVMNCLCKCFCRYFTSRVVWLRDCGVSTFQGVLSCVRRIVNYDFHIRMPHRLGILFTAFFTSQLGAWTLTHHRFNAKLHPPKASRGLKWKVGQQLDIRKKNRQRHFYSFTAAKFCLHHCFRCWLRTNLILPKTHTTTCHWKSWARTTANCKVFPNTRVTAFPHVLQRTYAHQCLNTCNCAAFMQPRDSFALKACPVHILMYPINPYVCRSDLVKAPVSSILTAQARDSLTNYRGRIYWSFPFVKAAIIAKWSKPRCWPRHRDRIAGKDSHRCERGGTNAVRWFVPSNNSQFPPVIESTIAISHSTGELFPPL